MEYFGLGWWAWFILGAVLLALELMTPGGFFLLFFGAAAIVVGTLAVRHRRTGSAEKAELEAGLGS